MQQVTTHQFIPPNSNMSGAYCPVCRDMMKVTDRPLVRQGHMFKCPLGHEMDQNMLAAMKPDMIPLVVEERPNSAVDAKAEIWVRKSIWDTFKGKYHGRISPTLNSILATINDEDFLMITGDVVRKLKKQNVHKQEDILALVEENIRLTAENEELRRDSQKINALFASAASALEKM